MPGEDADRQKWGMRHSRGMVDRQSAADGGITGGFSREGVDLAMFVADKATRTVGDDIVGGIIGKIGC